MFRPALNSFSLVKIYRFKYGDLWEIQKKTVLVIYYIFHENHVSLCLITHRLCMVSRSYFVSSMHQSDKTVRIKFLENFIIEF